MRHAVRLGGGGWVQLTFHHICSGCDAYSITPTDMQSLLDWLSIQVTGGAVLVETTEQVSNRRNLQTSVLLLTHQRYRLTHLPRRARQCLRNWPTGCR
jgi:hypothetical protein